MKQEDPRFEWRLWHCGEVARRRRMRIRLFVAGIFLLGSCSLALATEWTFLLVVGWLIIPVTAFQTAVVVRAPWKTAVVEPVAVIPLILSWGAIRLRLKVTLPFIQEWLPSFQPRRTGPSYSGMPGDEIVWFNVFGSILGTWFVCKAAAVIAEGFYSAVIDPTEPD